MKRNHGIFLIAAAIAALPGVSFAVCSGPATWDPSVRITRTTSIGWGTDIGAGASIGSYDRIGQCDDLGTDNSGIRVASRANVGNGITMTNASSIGYKANVGDDTSLDNTVLAGYVSVAGTTTMMKDSYLGGHTSVGTNAHFDGAKTGSYVIIGNDVTLTGSSFGYKVNLGDGVIVDSGVRIGRLARVEPGVHIFPGAYIAARAHVCADVGPGMTVTYKQSYGCP